MTWEIRQGHVLAQLRAMPAESVHCVVTSPPYWGLRAYRTEPQVWGGANDCEHVWTCTPVAHRHGQHSPDTLVVEHGPSGRDAVMGQEYAAASFCTVCGAWRGELGAEPTITLFVNHLVGVMAEVLRVLRSDGTCWLNIGDSYAGSGRGPTGHNGIGNQTERQGFANGNEHRHGGKASLLTFDEARLIEGSTTPGRSWVPAPEGIAAKNLCLIPERLVIALQDAGWWVRQRIAWCKRTPMPGSQEDRDTSAWEVIFHLTKRAHYWSDYEAVKEPAKSTKPSGNGYARPEQISKGGRGQSEPWVPTDRGVMPRNHWWIEPDEESEAWLLPSDSKPVGAKHYAVFPREIPRRCILRSAPLGGVVLDPFSGSGTTLFVAEELGRDSIGIELNPSYIKLAEKRMRGARTPLPGLL